MTAKAPLRLDCYVIDPLMRDLVGHDRKPSAYLVYLAIFGQNEDGVRAMSHQELADFTGLSRRSVQGAITHLARRKLIEVQRVGPTETAVYLALKPWKR